MVHIIPFAKPYKVSHILAAACDNNHCNPTNKYQVCQYFADGAGELLLLYVVSLHVGSSDGKLRDQRQQIIRSQLQLPTIADICFFIFIPPMIVILKLSDPTYNYQ